METQHRFNHSSGGQMVGLGGYHQRRFSWAYVLTDKWVRLTMPLLVFFTLIMLCTWSIHTLYPPQSPPIPNDMDYFVKVVDGRFVVLTDEGCKPFYVSGWNQWETVEAASGALQLYGARLPPHMSGPELVRSLLRKAKERGLNAVRTWVQPVTPEYSLIEEPGKYNEAVFRGLDYFIDECRKHGVRPILSLVDNWQQAGGVPQFVSFSERDAGHSAFFMDQHLKDMYKDHVNTILNRVNTINGRAYKDDPTILSWELINEGRCWGCKGDFAPWVKEMAAYVKSIDPNHLLTIGEEGFYPKGVNQSAANPQGLESWAFEEGQDFYVDHSMTPDIDYSSIHLWSQNWDDSTPQFVQTWIKQHIQDARKMNKPLLLSEFGSWGIGKFRKERDFWYDIIYGQVLHDIEDWGPMQGALFWQWYHEGQVAPKEESEKTPGGLFGVYETDSTFELIQLFTDQIKRINTYKFGGKCPIEKAKKADPAVDCSKTWIRDLSGTGFEGKGCTTDINECARGLHDCDRNAGCVNTYGGFECKCYNGYRGDGLSCHPDSEVLEQIYSSFFSNGAGQLACDEGTSIPYPEGAPGYAYDLIRGPDYQKLGSNVPVTKQDCMQACRAVESCNSFSFNEDQSMCFLKSAASADTCPVSFSPIIYIANTLW